MSKAASLFVLIRRQEILTHTRTKYGLSVLEIETFSKVYFAKEESFTRNVLGRQGWLDRVKLGLIDYEGKLLLSAYGK